MGFPPSLSAGRISKTVVYSKCECIKGEKNLMLSSLSTLALLLGVTLLLLAFLVRWKKL